MLESLLLTHFLFLFLSYMISRLRFHFFSSVWCACPPAFFFSIFLFGDPRSLALLRCRRSQAVEKLGGAEVFIGLTGTLIQNELGEFWWIMNMIENGVLKTDAEFKVRLLFYMYTV